MKIGLILCQNLKYSPYVINYINFLKKRHVEYDLIIWDKFGIDEPEGYVFHKVVSTRAKLKKTFAYIEYGRFIINTCKKNRYDRLIVFTIAPGMFILPYLLRNYSNKYVLDIRDASPFSKTHSFSKLVNHASFIVTSSLEYVSWIKREAIMSHNTDIGMVKEHLDDEVEIEKIEYPFRIVFAGGLIEGEINQKIIDKYKNDSNLHFHFVGNQTMDRKILEKWVTDSKITNVSFEGTYQREQVFEIYRSKADFINILRADTEVNRNAIPNKLYDAVIAGKPILVFDHNNGVAEYVNKYKLGVVINEDIDKFKKCILDGLNKNNYFRNLSNNRYNFLMQILHDNEVFEEMLARWLN